MAVLFPRVEVFIDGKWIETHSISSNGCGYILMETVGEPDPGPHRLRIVLTSGDRLLYDVVAAIEYDEWKDDFEMRYYMTKNPRRFKARKAP